MVGFVERARRLVVETIRRFPWVGWSGWLVFCAITLARTNPRRFASTFNYYLEAADRLLAHQPVYDPHTLGAFLYLPVSLLLLAPLTAIDPVAAAALSMLVYAVVFSWGAYTVVARLLPKGVDTVSAAQIAGVVLLVNVPAAWFNFKGVQSQIIMTGAMMAAAAAMMNARWLLASLWLFIGIAFKPLALVMALLCIVLVPRMRLPLILAIAAIFALPFLFFDNAYVVEQYRGLVEKMWEIAASRVEDWPYRADLFTLLAALGIEVPSPAAIAIRLVFSLGTLYLAWRVRQAGGPRSFAFALMILSAAYVNLLSPRNEFLSFILLTLPLAVLALLLLARDEADWRGWLLIAAALVLGMWWNLTFDAIVKPAIVLVLDAWLIYLMIEPDRWRALIENPPDPALR